MKKYLIVTPGYPSNENIYNNVFVHARVKQYQKNNLNVDVFSLEKHNKRVYNYDGVSVTSGDYNDLAQMLKDNNYSKICIHFAYKKIITTIQAINDKIPLLIWVHGVEALGWYRRLFTFNIKKPHRFIGYILFNTRQMLFMRKLIRSKDKDITFIFVSEWMKKILEHDTLSFSKITRYKIIPNVIDTKIFKYKPKKDNDRMHILSIRPYASKKYANDLSVEAVLLLSKKHFFKDLKFTFYGDGKLFDKTLEPIKKFNNVQIRRGFLNKAEIVQAHKENGVMLIPTRQDAQGVSMCEAMSSGLVPVTSNNTAIPEYVNNDCGYLTNSAKELADAIEELIKKPDLFKRLSEQASNFINQKCSEDTVITEELLLINKK